MKKVFSRSLGPRRRAQPSTTSASWISRRLILKKSLHRFTLAEWSFARKNFFQNLWYRPY